MRHRITFALLLAGLGFAVGVAAVLVPAAPAAAAPAKVAWEYKFVTAGHHLPIPDNGSDSPNVHGAEGWELVSVTVDATNGYVLYYKRPK